MKRDLCDVPCSQSNVKCLCLYPVENRESRSLALLWDISSMKSTYCKLKDIRHPHLFYIAVLSQRIVGYVSVGP